MIILVSHARVIQQLKHKFQRLSWTLIITLGTKIVDNVFNVQTVL